MPHVSYVGLRHQHMLDTGHVVNMKCLCNKQSNKQRETYIEWYFSKMNATDKTCQDCIVMQYKELHHKHQSLCMAETWDVWRLKEMLMKVTTKTEILEKSIDHTHNWHFNIASRSQRILHQHIRKSQGSMPFVLRRDFKKKNYYHFNDIKRVKVETWTMLL